MTTINSISPDKLARLLGRPDTPLLLDVRTAEDFAADPRLIPGARRLDVEKIAAWGPALKGRRVVVNCHMGRKLGEGAAAWLRHFGAQAEALEGGFVGWAAAGLPTLRSVRLPARDVEGRTVWVTRARPKIDRIACPWLIRRFIDPQAVFHFVAAEWVKDVAEEMRAIPFDIDGVTFSHRGDTCTFDTLLTEFGLSDPSLDHLARIVRAADTGAMDAEPEAAGLLAISLGLSAIEHDDLEQLERGMPIYDALLGWCRYATQETHNWPIKAA